MPASRFLLAILFLAILGYAVPAYAPPKCGGANPPPACNKDGDDTGGDIPRVIGVHLDRDVPANVPLWWWGPTDVEPECLLTKNSGKSLSGAFPRHALCATLTTDLGPFISDDIIVIVNTSNRGEVQDVQVQGQDLIGAIGVVHISDLIPVAPGSVIGNDDGTMVIHVHVDNVKLYKCNTHVLRKKSICEEVVGRFSLDDLVYSPNSEDP